MRTVLVLAILGAALSFACGGGNKPPMEPDLDHPADDAGAAPATTPAPPNK